MKISIRKGVFETNSSSIHSISIASHSNDDNIFEGEDIIINVRNYETVPEILNTPMERASYLLAILGSIGNGNLYNKEKGDIKEKIIEAFEDRGAKSVTINGNGVLYSSYRSEDLISDLQSDSYLFDCFLFGNTLIFIDDDNIAYLEEEVKQVGMDYDKGYMELKRSQYRIC